MIIILFVWIGFLVMEICCIMVFDLKVVLCLKLCVMVGGVVCVVGLGLWLFIMLFLLYWIVFILFKLFGIINCFLIEYWLSEFLLDNYISLFEKSLFGMFLVNLVIVVVLVGVVVIFIVLFSVYVLVWFEFCGKGVVFIVFLLMQMILVFIVFGLLYLMMIEFGFVDIKLGFIFVYIVICILFFMVMLWGFFENVFDVLEEVVMIDGCLCFGVLFWVFVLVMIFGIIVVFIFNFVNCWNELFLLVVLMNIDVNCIVLLVLNGFIFMFNIDWGFMSVVVVLIIFLMMVMFVFVSCWIVQGLMVGVVKEQFWFWL